MSIYGNTLHTSKLIFLQLQQSYGIITEIDSRFYSSFEAKYISIKTDMDYNLILDK